MTEFKALDYIILAFIFILIVITQVHEVQHYIDHKNMNCTNTSYQLVRVVSDYCPDIEKAQELGKYRDEQILKWTGLYWIVK